MTTHLPQVTRTYQFHSMDSTRWQNYRPRPDDIVISTSLKSGTTWMLEIVRQLVFQGQEVPERNEMPVGQVSTWPDAPWSPVEKMLEKLEAQQHRRFMKTHLPLDGLPFFPEVKYIVVGRDARDVAMSMWNHYAGMTAGAFEYHNGVAGRLGAPLPPPPQDIHTFWRDWISRGWFAWASEGYPFQPNLHHTQSWWEYRHLPNLLFVHYADLKNDFVGELRRIAAFLAIPLSDDALPALMQAASLDAMREREARLTKSWSATFKNGAGTFFFKGTNGRWRDVLSAEEVQMYEEKAAQVLTPDCRAWLEQGRMALGNG
ncbi:MAG: sulfotransferase domain-containing protein [Caldilineaceae bacterium]|nr:sulfotransferase domain-containing protein [Caldilineaceae bacterium]